jgi:hypothetical protein
MLFLEEEIDVARRLKVAGLPWTPNAGHYVYDPDGLIEQPSPFQPGVYFILDLKHFLRRSETLERLQAALVWLPQWHQARQLLRDQGVSDAEMAERLQTHDALAQRKELVTLYHQLLETLPDHA